MNTDTASRTFVSDTLTAVKVGDVIELCGPARTVESITHGWTGNSRNAQRRIRIRYTNGEGSVFTSTMAHVTITRKGN